MAIDLENLTVEDKQTLIDCIKDAFSIIKKQSFGSSHLVLILEAKFDKLYRFLKVNHSTKKGCL